MHIIAIAWLWVVLMLAITQKSLIAGGALFLALGVGPVALYAALAVRRLRARRGAARASVVEERVHPADHRDTQPDQ